jgi:uncharacterized protein
MQTLFEWDEDKARSNVRKHGVSFDEAQTVFTDEFSITIPDPEHSDEEERLLILGLSHRKHLLVVIYTERGKRIRLISARKANRKERKEYEEES